MLNNSPVIWNSRKQSIVATSTTEAEFIAAHNATKKVVWARDLLKVKCQVGTINNTLL